MELSLPIASQIYGVSRPTLCRIRQRGVDLAQPLDVADALLKRSTRNLSAVDRIVGDHGKIICALELLGMREPLPVRRPSPVIAGYAAGIGGEQP